MLSIMDWHIDDNGLLLGNNFRQALVNTGTHNYIDIGLKDIDVTFPQTTVSKFMINHIRFKFQGSSVPPNTSGYVRIQAGIVPVGIVADMSTLESYQKVEGWPLTKGSVYIRTDVQNPGSSGLISWSHTWRPKNKTALNRMQDIRLDYFTISGDFETLASIQVEGKRVD